MLQTPVGKTQVRKRRGPHPTEKVVVQRVGRALEQAGRNLHIGQDYENDDVNDDVEERTSSSPPPNVRLVNIRETRYFAAGWAVIGFVLWWIYAAFILVNMNYTYGYTQMRLPPSPGPFNSSRYGFPWAMSYMLWFNLLGPLTLLAGLAEIQYKSRLTINFALSWLLLFVNAFAFCALLGIWIGYCNQGYSFGSPCDDPRNCCVNYGSSLGMAYCPTASGCTPGVSWSQLSRWNPFFLSFLWSLFFALYCFFSLSVNQQVRGTIRSQSDANLMLGESEGGPPPGVDASDNNNNNN
jgi:hypothetical protein